MKLRGLLEALEKPVTSGDLDTEIIGIVYDSRKVAPGFAFVALRGVSSDGHDFIPKAIERGASVILAEQAPPTDCAVPWVHVRHSRIALADAAAAFHGFPSRGMLLAGVTGTNGKTTIGFLLHHLMNGAQLRAGLLGTVFYDLGGEQVPATHTTPESLEIQGLLSQMKSNGCRGMVMEVSSHALDQQRVHGLAFDAAIFTNLTQDHLDYHGTMENYFQAKGLLFQSVADAGKGQMIINMDDPWGRKLIIQHESTGRVTRYGFGVGADFRANDVRYDMTGTTFTLTAKGRDFLVRLPLIGDFNIYNALAAIAAGHALGINLRESIQSLKNAPQVPGRLERVTETGNLHVYVDYAHTPDALINVLRTLRALKPKRIITVFGCGGDRDLTKRPKMARAAEEGSDICVLTSDNPRSEDPAAIIADAKKGFSRSGHLEIADRKQAIRTAIENARDGDIILLAGKGHEDYQEIKGVRHPFDDRKIARQCLYGVKASREPLWDDRA